MPFKHDVRTLAAKIVAGEPRAIAQAITLVESTCDGDKKIAQQLLELLPPKKAICVGISGAPGVGKSTLLEKLGMYLIENKKMKVAVLAIDPSSSVSGGSILGDKTRMTKLAAQKNAFIRPQPSGGALGGVSAGTRQAIAILSAAGFDVVFVETVGVGQSESDIAAMVDKFVMLMQPGSGDELQAMKRGAQELADILIVTKNDGDMAEFAEKTARQWRSALAMSNQSHRKTTKVLTISSVTNKNIAEMWQLIVE